MNLSIDKSRSNFVTKLLTQGNLNSILDDWGLIKELRLRPNKSEMIEA